MAEELLKLCSYNFMGLFFWEMTLNLGNVTLNIHAVTVLCIHFFINKLKMPQILLKLAGYL